MLYYVNYHFLPSQLGNQYMGLANTLLGGLATEFMICSPHVLYSKTVMPLIFLAE